jgi:LacI family transcriptional regulator
VSDASSRPTRLDDVARLAGVSVGTVSHAINHPHRLAPATLARVQRAIDDLGFVPDRRARSLARGTSSVIGFVVIDLTNSYFVDMARGAEDEAAGAGMFVLLGNTDVQAEKERSYLRLFEEERVAGILLTPTANLDDQAWRPRAPMPVPVVLLNTEAGSDRCSVLPDDELGGYLAARHLIEVGRRRLVFAGALFRLAPVARRLRGVERAVAEAGGAVSLSTMTADGLRPQHGRVLGARIAELPEAERPDGVVAAADLLALGIVQAVAHLPGLSVPDDLSVVGYDDNQAAWESAVPLTTVAQPGLEVGRTGTRLLLEEVRERTTHVHRVVRLPPTLVVRSSSVPAARPGGRPRRRSGA